MVDEEKTAEETPQTKKSIFQKPIIVIAIIVVVQIAIALVLGKVMSGRTIKACEEVKKAGEWEAQAVEGEGEGTRGKIVMLDDIVVNLKERDKLYYLKIAIGLEVPNAAVQKEVEERQAQLKDDVISLLSGKRIIDIDGIEERNALKAELHKRISESLLTGDLIQVYFSDFVIQ